MKAFSGKPADALTLDAVRSGDVSLDDIRIAPATLEHQARVAAARGELPRAAELATLPDSEVLAIYESLRPHVPPPRSWRPRESGRQRPDPLCRPGRRGR